MKYSFLTCFFPVKIHSIGFFVLLEVKLCCLKLHVQKVSTH